MSDDHDGGFEGDLPESLLPYDEWVEDAYREVMLRALEHAALEGMPGDHHFYLTFQTDYPGVRIPDRLRAQYPHEMTIVLQHQFWDLTVDRRLSEVSVGLSFGGIGSTLVIPFAAITAFADPHVRMALRFNVAPSDAADETSPPPETSVAADEPEEDAQQQDAQVVSLDAFRRRPPQDERN